MLEAELYRQNTEVRPLDVNVPEQFSAIKSEEPGVKGAIPFLTHFPSINKCVLNCCVSS